MSIEYIVKHKFHFRLNHAFYIKMANNSWQTNGHHKIMNFVNVYVKWCNNSRRKPHWVVQGISWNDQLNAAFQILSPKIQVLSDSKQLPVVGHLLDNILMIYELLMFCLIWYYKLQTWQCNHPQLTSQEVIHNANNGCILQIELAWLNTDTPSLSVKLWTYPSYHGVR